MERAEAYSTMCLGAEDGVDECVISASQIELFSRQAVLSRHMWLCADGEKLGSITWNFHFARADAKEAVNLPRSSVARAHPLLEHPDLTEHSGQNDS